MSSSETPDLVIARILEYFGRRTNWHRRLWNPGTVTVVEELLEALQFMQSGHLGRKLIEELARTAERRVGPDLGLGTPNLRSCLTATLKTVPQDALARFALEHYLEEIKPNYLNRWSSALDQEPGSIGTEYASRLLAGHLSRGGVQPGTSSPLGDVAQRS